MITRTVRWVLFAALLICAAWIWFLFPQHPWWAVLGALGFFFFPLLTQALEFALMAWRRPAAQFAQPPGWATLIFAWLRECALIVRVYYWEQPFRSQAFADSGARAAGALPPGATTPQSGVVLIHGYLCNRAFWNGFMPRLQAQGVRVTAISYEPTSALIDQHVATVEAAVKAMQVATGQPPILICHSMGGLVARAWLRAQAGNADRVQRIMTLSSPHHGTWLAQFASTPSVQQMRENSAWLAQLDADLSPEVRAKFICWYSNCDQVVFPVPTTLIDGAESRLAPGRGHVTLAYDTEVQQQLLDAIAARNASSAR